MAVGSRMDGSVANEEAEKLEVSGSHSNPDMR